MDGPGLLGQNLSETRLAKALGTKAFGTLISNVQRLQHQGYQVELGSLTVEELAAHLQVGQPVIARVWTEFLDNWQAVATFHVVVVAGYDDSHVYLSDPALKKKTPQQGLRPINITLDSTLKTA